MKHITVTLLGNKEKKRDKKYKYYHISPIQDKIIRVLEPRIPTNEVTKYGYEDDKVARVCLAPSIGKCIAALAQNVKNRMFRVYGVVGEPRGDTPSINRVPDVKITQEYWATENVNVEYIGLILVLHAKPSMLEYEKCLRQLKQNPDVSERNSVSINSLKSFFKNKQEHRTFEIPQVSGRHYLYDWRWTWVETSSIEERTNSIQYIVMKIARLILGAEVSLKSPNAKLCHAQTATYIKRNIDTISDRNYKLALVLEKSHNTVVHSYVSIGKQVVRELEGNERYTSKKNKNLFYIKYLPIETILEVYNKLKDKNLEKIKKLNEKDSVE